MTSLYNSTVGKKIIVAVTGIILFGFVVGHLLGNLQIFLGPQVFNEYAEFLAHKPLLVWGTRIVLLISVILHFSNTVQLAIRNKASRPISYQKQETIQASVASKTMVYGGLFLAIYIVFHLLHLTLGVIHPNFNKEDVYANVVNGFAVWPVSLFYIFGMGCLGMHLFHGLWSLFQTLGLNHPKWNGARRSFATVVAITVALGYISIPVAVLLRLVK